MLVNRLELAKIFGVTRPTVDAWIDEGLPFKKRGSRGVEWSFETVEVLGWWVENKAEDARDGRTAASRIRGAPASDGAESYEDAERRKMVAQADKAELEMAKAAGLVVYIEDVAAEVLAANLLVRAHLLNIPNAIRARVASYMDRTATEKIVSEIEQVISEAMAELRDEANGNGGEDDA